MWEKIYNILLLVGEATEELSGLYWRRENEKKEIGIETGKSAIKYEREKLTRGK